MAFIIMAGTRMSQPEAWDTIQWNSWKMRSTVFKIAMIIYREHLQSQQCQCITKKHGEVVRDFLFAALWNSECLRALDTMIINIFEFASVQFLIFVVDIKLKEKFRILSKMLPEGVTSSYIGWGI